MPAPRFRGDASDLLLGLSSGRISFLSNTGTSRVPSFVQRANESADALEVLDDELAEANARVGTDAEFVPERKPVQRQVLLLPSLLHCVDPRGAVGCEARFVLLFRV